MHSDSSTVSIGDNTISHIGITQSRIHNIIGSKLPPYSRPSELGIEEHCLLVLYVPEVCGQHSETFAVEHLTAPHLTLLPLYTVPYCPVHTQYTLLHTSSPALCINTWTMQ